MRLLNHKATIVDIVLCIWIGNKRFTLSHSIFLIDGLVLICHKLTNYLNAWPENVCLKTAYE